jgi:hypothetical protein
MDRPRHRGTIVPRLTHRDDGWYVSMEGATFGPFHTADEAHDHADDLMAPGEPDELDVVEQLQQRERDREWQRRS